MKTKIKIAVIAMMGMSMGVNGQDQIKDRLTITNSNNDQVLHLRPNSGNSGYIYWAENGVAERGILGFKKGSRDLVYASGGFNFDNSIERFRIKSNGDAIFGGYVNGSNFVAVNSNNSASTSLQSYGIDFNRSLSYLQPMENKTSRLFIGGYTSNDKDWKEVNVRSSIFKVFHKGYFGGDVGIGTTSPNAKLEVKGSETSYHQLIVGGGVGAAIQLESRNNTTQRPVLSANNGNFSIQMWKNRGTWKSTPFHIDSNGMIGMGIKDTKGFKLGVNGKIAATEVKVATYSNWADFVFKEDYHLPTLIEVENHIKEKGHLKDIPSAKEVEENGIYLGEMDSKLLQKIEELTLYTIEQEKKLDVQQKEIEELKKQNSRIKDLEILVQKLLKDKN
ncbi:hypothetical protein [Tenacibaculum sp. C7A-26P2]|uniref:hypothetical protein n=1 Tax=Tenacibaculum sp. C7A-26P2 TaxID=3447504 RepID=UPI003F869DE1